MMNICSNMSGNIFQPYEARIEDIVDENSNIKTYMLKFSDKKLLNDFSYVPGQFVMLSVPGCGEAPISISSSPTMSGVIHLSVRKAGRLTSALHDMKAGDCVGIRGPYGRPFPMDELKGKDLLFVAGGIGLAPLRSVISFCLDRKGEYGRITLLYGSRTPSDMAFGADIARWSESGDVDVRLTVDVAESGWSGKVGLVTNLIDDIEMDVAGCSALLCGPPLMIDAVTDRLLEAGLAPGSIITTMERNMKCGVGLCGHCHMGNVLVCREGPVFTVEELRETDRFA